MKYEELIILLPCHSLEDFPLYHEGDEAQGLLASWVALWHPDLIAAAGAMPIWRRVDDPPEELANRLIVIPAVSMHELPTGFAQRAKSDGACVVRRKLTVEEIQQAALAEFDAGDLAASPDAVADFLALGYCYLQIELLTRQMRYSSNLDEVHFQNLVVAAANAAANNEADAHEKLAACFDLLGEERDHYYPVDAYLLDLTMVAETTLGESLRNEIDNDAATNLLLPANLLNKLAESNPDLLAAIGTAWREGRISVLGGEAEELRTSLLSLESCLSQLRLGREAASQHCDRPTEVYARRRFGPTPHLPQLLSQLGYTGALHANFDEGVMPEAGQAKIRWEGLDGSAMDCISRTPLDAAKPESYLNLAVKLGEAMDSDHVAALTLAHWPGAAAVWLDCLRRISRFTGALGKFITFEEFFRDTDMPGGMERFESRDYRSPYLKQAVIRRVANPISSSVRYWHRRGKLEAVEALETLRVALKVSSTEANDATAHVGLLAQRIDTDSEQALDDTLDGALDQCLGDTTAALAAALPKRSESETRGYLCFNPASFVRRVGIHANDLDQLPAPERPIYAVGHFGEERHAVIDIPPMGFLWLPESSKPTQEKHLPAPLAEETTLRNEFFEATISAETGGLGALHEYNARSNRISQQIAMRLPGTAAAYSTMRADSVEVTAASSALGEITSRGKLLDPAGEQLAGFVQVYRIWRGSRVLQVEVELDCDDSDLRSDGWRSYIAARFAWANEAADLWRDLHQTRVAFSGKRSEAPHYVEIEDGDTSTTVLTGGLPFHARSGERMLDSLLVVRGETARKFKFGIGVELKQPLLEAISLRSPTPRVLETTAPPAPADSSWLFQIDVRRIIATHWEPVIDDDRVVGIRVRLLETGGRAAHAKLMGFRPFTSARRVDFAGNVLAESKLADGAVEIDLAPHQFSQFECRWA